MDGWMDSRGGVSEGTGREKCGRLLPCWTRGPTRRPEEHGNRDPLEHTRVATLLTPVMGGSPDSEFGIVILGREWLVIRIDLLPETGEEDDSIHNERPPPRVGARFWVGAGKNPFRKGRKVGVQKGKWGPIERGGGGRTDGVED
eukprot:scaffold856_cov326-Pavlova_lutheri.AAC.24